MSRHSSWLLDGPPGSQARIPFSHPVYYGFYPGFSILKTQAGDCPQFYIRGQRNIRDIRPLKMTYCRILLRYPCHDATSCPIPLCELPPPTLHHCLLPTLRRASSTVSPSVHSLGRGRAVQQFDFKTPARAPRFTGPLTLLTEAG